MHVVECRLLPDKVAVQRRRSDAVRRQRLEYGRHLRAEDGEVARGDGAIRCRASSASTGLTSPLVNTRSPITVALAASPLNPAQAPRASAGETVTSPIRSVTSRRGQV